MHWLKLYAKRNAEQKTFHYFSKHQEKTYILK